MPSHSTQTPEVSKARPVILKDPEGFLSLLQVVLARGALTPRGRRRHCFLPAVPGLVANTHQEPSSGSLLSCAPSPRPRLLSGEVSSYQQTADDSDSDICPCFPGGLDTTREHLGRNQGVFSTALTWELQEWDFLKYKDQGKGVFLVLRTGKRVSFGRCCV